MMTLMILASSPRNGKHRMMDLAALILATAGFAAIALSMHKHHRDLFGRPPSRPRALAFAGAGWSLLALSFGASIVVSGWAIGPVLWIGLLTVAALVVALTLTLQVISPQAKSTLSIDASRPKSCQPLSPRLPAPRRPPGPRS